MVAATGIAPTHDGQGYWIVDGSGTVYPFGDATLDAGPAVNPDDYIVSIVATPDGGGYWLLGDLGYIYAYGDAVNYPYTG